MHIANKKIYKQGSDQNRHLRKSAPRIILPYLSGKSTAESNPSPTRVVPLHVLSSKTLDKKTKKSTVPTEKDIEDMTSNDTIPVSNETEAKLSVDETAPDYFELNDDYNMGTSEELKEIANILKDGLLKPNITDERELKNNLKISEINTPKKEYAKEISSELLSDSTSDNRLNSFSKNTSGYGSHFPQPITHKKPFNLGNHGDNPHKRNEVVRTRANVKNNLAFGRLLKHFENILGMSRISNHNDLQHVEKLLNGLNRTVHAYARANGKKIQGRNSLGETRNIEKLFGAVSRMMHVTDKNKVFKSLTAILSKLTGKFDKIHDNLSQYKKETLVSGIKNFSSTAIRNGHLKITDMKKKIEELNKVFQKHLRDEKLDTCKRNALILDQLTLTDGLESKIYTKYDYVLDINQCIAQCCDTSCDVALLIDQQCFTINCKRQKCVLAPNVHSRPTSTIALVNKDISANIGFTGIPLKENGFSQDKCQIQTHIIKNSILKESGLKGNATILGHVTDSWSCGMTCCQHRTCNVAMVQRGACYVISCLTDGPCFDFQHASGQTVSLAFVRKSNSPRKLKLQPSMHLSSFQTQERPKKTEALPVTPSSTQKDQSSVALGHVSQRKSLVQEKTRPTLIFNYDILSKVPQSYMKIQSSKSFDVLHSSSSVHSSKKDAEKPARRSHVTRLTKDNSSQCFETFPLVNVTLRGGFSAGDFKFQGQVSNDFVCLELCCNDSQCNIALMLRDVCYLVACKNNKLCQNVPLMPSAFETRLTYTARNSLEADLVKKELVPTLEQSKTTKKSQNFVQQRKANVSFRSNKGDGCVTGFIASNSMFAEGFEAGVIISEGILKGGMNECISKCCDYDGCNATLLVQSRCFLVQCYSTKSCQIVQSDSPDLGSAIAIITREKHDQSLSFLSPEQRKHEVPSGTRRTHVFPAGEKSSELVTPALKEEVPQVDNDLETTELLKELHSEVKRFMNAKNVSTNANTLPDELLGALRNVYRRLNSTERHIADLSKNVHHSRIFKNNVSKQDSDDLSETLRTIPETKEKENSGLENKNHAAVIRESDVKNIVLDILAKKLKTHEADVQERHIASRISNHWNHSTMGDAKALLSKMEQLIVQQKQFNENVSKLPESLANLQHYLDFDARPNTSSEYEVKSHDAPSSIVHKKDPVLQDLQTSTVYKPQTSSNSLTHPAKNLPTPKLVNSPTLLVTSPSFIGSPDLKSTNHRAVASTRDSFNERGKVLGKGTDDLFLGGLGLGKEIVEALKDAGVIPIKKEHSEKVKILSSLSISKTSTKGLKKEPSTKIREQSLVANNIKTFKTNPKAGYSTVPPVQRLLNFLEENVGMKPLVSKSLQKSNGVPKAIEEFSESIHSSKISGPKGVNSELNQRINKLESMIINLRNDKNFQPSPSQHKPSTSADVLGRLKILEAAFKHYGSQTYDFLRNHEEKPNFVDVRKDLVQQLRGIVRSELSHHETNISPTVVLKSYHPENTKDLELGNNAVKRNEVKLASHLDELYSHAVNEIKKALVSIVPNKAQSVVASLSHSLPSHEKGDKNILLSNKAGDTIKSEKSVASGVPTSEDEFQKITILPNDKPQTISASLNNKTKSPKVPDSLGYQAKPKMKSEFLDKAANSEKLSAPFNRELKSQKNAGSSDEEWKVGGNEKFLGKSQNGVSSESKTLERICHYSAVQNDVSLRGGIVREGIHDGGIVKDMNECLQRCCERDACDVAFMLSANCFLVPCKDRELCRSIELPTKSLNSRLAFVSRYSQAVTKLEDFDRVVNAITLSPVPKPSSSSPVASISIPPLTQLQNKKFEKVITPKLQVCPVGSTEYNMTLKGGMAAARYKYAGKVADIDECVKHCCQLNNCDIAFTFSNECFLLTCKSIDLCESVPASSTELNPKMVRLLRHNADRHLPRKPSPDAVLKKVLTPTSHKASMKRKSEKRPNTTRKAKSGCLKSDAILHVVPKEGKKAGDYKDFGKVTSLEECVEHCCAWARCNMAFMVLNGCFGISCTNHCQVVPSNDLTFESKVVYVKRRQEVLYWLTSQSNTRSTLPGTSDNPKTEMRKPFSLSNVDRAEDVIPAQQQLTPSPAPSPKPTSYISEKTTNSKDKRGDGIKPQINVQAAVEPKTSAKTGDKNAQCIVGDIEYDVTLGGGINAGLYTEQGEVGDMMNCVDLCCKQRKCNVAMVIKDICYTVACYDPQKCASVPVRRIQYHPKLVHVKRLEEVKQRDQGDPRGHLRTSSIKDGSSENDEVSKRERENSNMEDELVEVLDDLNSRDPNGHKEKNRIIMGHKGTSVNTGDEHKQQVSSEITEIDPKLNKVIHADSNEDPMDLKPYQARRPMEALAGSASSVVDLSSCLHSPISYNVTLRHGLRSGYFKTQGRVDNFETCFQRCCQDQNCNLVYLLRHYCYLVTCFDEGSCALAPLVYTSKELVIAFVHKKRRKEFSPMTQPSSLPVNYQTFIPNHEPDIMKENQISLPDQGFSSNNQPPVPIQQQTLYSFGNNQPNVYPLPKSDSEVNLAQAFKTDQPPPPSSPPSYTSPQCVPGPDRYLVTLRGGINSGNFDDVGRVASMDVCKRHCCDKSDCDVAFMLQDRCFLVSCRSRQLCDDVHASSSRYVTRISHMLRGKRSGPFTNDQRDTGLPGDADSQGRWGTMNERKDRIPNGHENKGDTSLQPDQPSQEDLRKDMDLLEDMMKQTATTKGSRKDELSSSGTERVESKTPDRTNTGFEGLVNGNKHAPLVYDEVAGRRQHGLKGEDLGDMASDILKNIVKHRTDDSIDAVLSDSPDPLAREVNKMKGKPDNDEKDFLNFQKQRTHSHPSDGISKNPVVQQESPAGREGNKGDTSDESKLIQSLLLLMNEKVRMDKEKDDRDKQRNTKTQDSVLDDVLAGTVNSGPEFQSKQAPSDDETMAEDKNAPTNDNFDYIDDEDGDDNFDVYDNHAKDVPRISQKQKTNPTLPRITEQTYPTVYSPDNELYNKDSPGKEIDDTQTEGQSRESEQENSLEAGRNSNPKNLNNWQLHNTEHDTEDIGNNADRYGDNGDDYNSEDQFDDNADLQNSLDDYEDQEDPGDLGYDDVIGGKRKLHNNSLRHPTLTKGKGPSPSVNKNLVMNELGKIENELSNIKSGRFPEDRAQGKNKSKENNSNSLKKAKEKGKEDEKEDINDILHSLEELEKSKKLLNDIKDKGQKKSSQKPGAIKKTPSDSSPNATDENMIFRELNDIKAGIANMTKGPEKDKKVEKLPTADDVGEDISDILDEEDWDPGKRSDIPYPPSREKPEHKATPGSSSENSRMTSPENSFSGNQLIGTFA